MGWKWELGEIRLTETPNEKNFRSHNEFALAVANAVDGVVWGDVEEVINDALPDGFKIKLIMHPIEPGKDE